MNEVEMMRAALLEGGLVEGIDFNIREVPTQNDCPFSVTYRSEEQSPIIHRALRLVSPYETPCYECWIAGTLGPEDHGCEHTNATTH